MEDASALALGSVAEELLSLVADGVITTDAKGSIVLFNPSAEKVFGYRAAEVLGKKIEMLLPDRLRPAHEAHVRHFVHSNAVPQHLMSAGRDVLGLKKNGEEFPVEARISRHTIAGQPLLTVVLRDVTERRRVEDARRLVTQEMSHRLKNLMTIVTSVVCMTARASASVAAYERQLLERLGALGRTVDLMLRDNWSGASLAELVHAELEPYRSNRRRNCRLSGPEVQVPPHWALSLTLALHELATNAAKYGALSTRAGVVSIAWQIDPKSSRTVLLDWVETGGPPVEPPARTGFGSDLIARSIGRSRTRLTYDPAGFAAHFQIPL